MTHEVESRIRVSKAECLAVDLLLRLDTLQRLRSSDDRHLPKFFEHEQVVIAGNDCIGVRRQSTSEYSIVVGIAAYR